MCEIPPPYSREDEEAKLEALRRGAARNTISVNWSRPFLFKKSLKTADILCATVPDQEKPVVFRRTANPCPTCPVYEKVELDPAELQDLIDTQDFL